jgi:protease-4
VRRAGGWAAGLAVALCATLGCDARERAAKQEPAAGQGASPKDGADAGAAAPSAPMAAAGLMGALGRVGEPGYYDEPKQSPGVRADQPHHVIVEIAGGVAELESFSFFGGGQAIKMRTLTGRLHELAADANVKSILLRFGDLGVSMAQAEELRATLASVRTAGKPVHCFVDGSANAGYFVLSACDSITLTPTGEVVITGPAVQPLYLKGLLDKLGVEADFLHVGAFKGAAEPLTRTAPSPEMRATYDAILDGAYKSLVDGIAAGRKLDRAKVIALVDEAMFTDARAKQAGLVDEILTWEAWRDARTAGGAWKKITIEKPRAQDLSALMDLLGATPRKRISEPHVALLYAVGNVVDGKGGNGALGASQEIAPRRLGPALRAVADDDSVKAIVLRVDSGGGSALASETIWHAVHYAKSKKPVVVSMGSMAASGGYYISAGADAIWAQPDTLTGSIGVVGGKIVLGGALEKFGVTTVEIARGKRAGLMNAMRKWTTDERATIEASMKAVYGQFVARVAEGRKLTVDQVEAIAQGRVWIGADAKAKGLVDQLGGLDDALADARKRASLPDDSPVDVYPPDPTLLDFLNSFVGGDVTTGALGVRGVTGVLAEVAGLLGPDARAVVETSLASLLSFRGCHVQTVALVPFVLK